MDIPELADGLGLVMDAFWDLSSTRPADGGTIGNIPWTALDQWMTRHGVVGDQYHRMMAVLRTTDDAYVTKFNAKQAAKRKKDAERKAAERKRKGSK